MIGGSKFTFDIEKYGNCNGRGGGHLTIVFSAEKSHFKIETHFYISDFKVADEGSKK